MSLGHGAKIVTDNLVFAYDINSKLSFKGKPVTNEYPDLFTSGSMRNHTKHYWNGNSWLIGGTYTHPGIPGPKGVFLGKVSKHTSGALNSSWSGNSYGYMLRDISNQTVGSYYTQSCWVYVSYDCDISSIPSTIEGEQGGETSPSSGESGSYNMNSKGTWQRLGKRAISDGNTRYIPVYPRKNGVTDGSFSGFFMWGGVQVEEGSFVSPLISSDNGVATRLNTEALIDWTGNSIITANSLTYNPDNTFEFINASNNYATATGSGLADGMGQYTVAFWARRDVESKMPVSSAGSTNFYWYGDNSWRYTHGGTSGEYYYPKSVNIPIGTWGYYVATYDGSNVRIYRNGVYEGAKATTGTANWAQGIKIGGWTSSSSYAYDGMISVVNFYNRALTNQEIKQNFNALRGRFGI